MGKVLKVREVGDPALGKISEEVDIENINSEIIGIIEDLKTTLQFGTGLGIAAPQIGVNKKIIVVGASKDNITYNDAEDIPLTAMINPSWRKLSEDTDIQYEGCMSVPEIRGKVERYKEIELTYYNEDGKKIVKNLKGFFSRLIQHECDHLEGITFLEKVKTPNGFATKENIKKYGLRNNNIIKNIIFDLGNVLLGWNEDYIVSKFADNDEEKEILKKVIFKSEEWFKLDEGLINYKEAMIIFKEKLPSNLQKKLEKIMSTWYEYMPMNMDICNLIKKLKENNYNVYALSNTHISVYEYVKNSECGKYFDGFLISAKEKMMKPNANIYYRLFEKFKLNPEESFFIDDNEQNIIASEKCGMRGYVFDINNFEGLIRELKKNNIIIK